MRFKSKPEHSAEKSTSLNIRRTNMGRPKRRYASVQNKIWFYCRHSAFAFALAMKEIPLQRRTP